MRRKFIILLAVLAVPANAQMSVDFGSVGSSIAGITTPVILNPCTPGSCGKASPRADTRQPMRVTYQPSDALARETLSGYVGRIARTNPAAARQVAEQFARYDYRKVYDGLIAGTGLRGNDAVDTMTAYTILGWMIATNAMKGIDDAFIPAVRTQIASRFSRDPRLAAAGVGAKLSEELKLQYVVLQSGWQSSQKEGNMPAYSDGVAKIFRAQSGQDLRALKLTRDGFVTR